MSWPSHLALKGLSRVVLAWRSIGTWLVTVGNVSFADIFGEGGQIWTGIRIMIGADRFLHVAGGCGRTLASKITLKISPIKFKVKSV